MEWTITPSLVMDEVNGLSVLVCKDHTTKELKSKFFHIPQNPLFEDNADIISPEYMAPVAIIPTIARGGRIGDYTSSTPVVKSIGGYFGMSTFQIGQNPYDYEYDFEGNRELRECLASENREEIRNTFIANYGVENFKVNMIKYNTYFKNNPGLRAEITESLKGSTFMDISDSYHAWCLTKKQNT
jgi:hypothetical protein